MDSGDEFETLLPSSSQRSPSVEQECENSATCPVCLYVFSATESSLNIQDHVNRCLDGGAALDAIVDELAPDVKTDVDNNNNQKSDAKKRLGSQNDDAEFGNLFFCWVCFKELSRYNQSRRSLHLNRCLDDVSQIFGLESEAVSDVDPGTFAKTADSLFLSSLSCCPICDESLETAVSSRSKVSHLKSCAKAKKMEPRLLLEVVLKAGERQLMKRFLKGHGTATGDKSVKYSPSNLAARKRKVSISFDGSSSSDDDNDNVDLGLESKSKRAGTARPADIHDSSLAKESHTTSSREDAFSRNIIGSSTSTFEDDFTSTSSILISKARPPNKPLHSSSFSKPRNYKNDPDLQLALALSASLTAPTSTKPKKRKRKTKANLAASSILAITEAKEYIMRKAVRRHLVEQGSGVWIWNLASGAPQTTPKKTFFSQTDNLPEKLKDPTMDSEFYNAVLSSVECGQGVVSIQHTLYSRIHKVEIKYSDSVQLKTIEVEEQIRKLRQEHLKWMETTLTRRDEEIQAVLADYDECLVIPTEESSEVLDELLDKTMVKDPDSTEVESESMDADITPSCFLKDRQAVIKDGDDAIELSPSMVKSPMPLQDKRQKWPEEGGIISKKSYFGTVEAREEQTSKRSSDSFLSPSTKILESLLDISIPSSSVPKVASAAELHNLLDVPIGLPPRPPHPQAPKLKHRLISQSSEKTRNSEQNMTSVPPTRTQPGQPIPTPRNPNEEALIWVSESENLNEFHRMAPLSPSSFSNLNPHPNSKLKSKQADVIVISSSDEETDLRKEQSGGSEESDSGEDPLNNDHNVDDNSPPNNDDDSTQTAPESSTQDSGTFFLNYFRRHAEVQARILTYTPLDLERIHDDMTQEYHHHLLPVISKSAIPFSTQELAQYLDEKGVTFFMASVRESRKKRLKAKKIPTQKPKPKSKAMSKASTTTVTANSIATVVAAATATLTTTTATHTTTTKACKKQRSESTT